MLQGVFGKYRIEGIVGVGGMAVVYRAVDETQNRLTAIKILNAQTTIDSIGMRRFQREAEIAQRLDHPDIITVYEHGVIGELAYLAMEYMSGGSLAQRFVQPRPISLGESAQILKTIASALDYAHSKGVVHRDLKLENVLVNDQGHLVLSDFGIARILNVSSLTDTGQTFGTPLYVSPEQVRGAKQVDFRADIYSLAVIAYLLATGYFPFSAASEFAILNQHLTQEPLLPSNLNPRLPPQMDWVLLKGLSKHPEDRFASAGALARTFEAAITNLAAVETVVLATQLTPILSQIDYGSTSPIVQHTGSDTRPIGTIMDAPRSQRRAKVAASILLALLLVAFVAIILLKFSGIPEVPAALTLPATSDAALLGVESTSTATLVATVTSATQIDLPLTNTLTPSPIFTPTMLVDTSTPQPVLMASATPEAMPLLTTLMPTSTRAASVVAPTVAAPATVISATTKPPTAVPPIHAAPTAVPPTAVPPTHVPPTAVPPTVVPPTTVPPTSVPPTTAPTSSGLLGPILPPVVPTLIGRIL